MCVSTSGERERIERMDLGSHVSAGLHGECECSHHAFSAGNANCKVCHRLAGAGTRSRQPSRPEWMCLA